MGKRREESAPKHKRSLETDIQDPAAYGVRTKPRAEKRRRRLTEDEGDDAIDDKTSHRILQVARQQQDEIEDEGREGEGLGALAGALRKPPAAAAARGAAAEEGPSSDIDSENEDLDGYGSDREYVLEEEEVSPEDEAALRAFMAPVGEGTGTRTLADIILDKIREQQRAQGVAPLPEDAEDMGEGVPPPLPEGLDERVVQVYRAVGQLMRRYTTGSVPKAFKVIPGLTNWEEILYLTEPEGWSPHAVYQATRLFSSNLNAKMAQRFFSLVLLPRFREDIREHRRLHFMLFQALKKAMYKPGAFYKGVLLPLCQSRTCTLREAVIMSSVIKRVSIPVVHSAAALLRMAEMEYCGTTSFFIRVLLDKKYALPYRVIDALVDHFLRFQTEKRALPVVWHHALLCFVQRYKTEIRSEDKEALKALSRMQFHHLVSTEIHRELDASRSRGQRADGPGAMEARSRVVGAGVCGAREDPRALAPVVVMEDDL